MDQSHQAAPWHAAGVKQQQWGSWQFCMPFVGLAAFMNGDACQVILEHEKKSTSSITLQAISVTATDCYSQSGLNQDYAAHAAHTHAVPVAALHMYLDFLFAFSSPLSIAGSTCIKWTVLASSGPRTCALCWRPVLHMSSKPLFRRAKVNEGTYCNARLACAGYPGLQPSCLQAADDKLDMIPTSSG